MTLVALRASAGKTEFDLGLAVLEVDRQRHQLQALEIHTHTPAIDLLAGTAAVREGIEAGASLDDLAQRWPRDEGAFSEQVAEFRLYD